MKLGVLALDYDGTIAVDGAFNPSVRDSIAEARRCGVAVVLVTGRRLTDLHASARDLSCFDVVVAENGAVLEFPASGRLVQLGHAPPASVVQMLRQRQVPIAIGDSVIEADAAAAPAILDIIRRLEQPLIMAFNRGRLMVLPPAVAKSTGLRHALFELRLSIHNALGIGDAENDHDLLDACEVGVAVGWGSPTLKAIADEVIEGSGPEAVAAYIRRVCHQSRLSAAQMGRRKLVLGTEHNGDPVILAVRGRTIVIAGEPGSGKSWLAGLICEQLTLQGYCLCIFDPEGDYRSLEALPNVILLGGDDPLPQTRELFRALKYPDVSVIVDLSKVSREEKCEYLRHMLPALAALRRRTGLPHKILVDEAHYFVSGPEAIDRELAGYILVTYRVSLLDRSLCSGDDVVVLVTRESDPPEVATLSSLCPAGTTPSAASMFSDLAMNEAALLPGAAEAGGRIRRFRVGPRLTEHVRHQSKYLDMPVSEDRGFVFWTPSGPGPRARTLKEFAAVLTTLPNDAIAGHLRRHDFSQWIRGVFRDGPLAKHVHNLEKRIATDTPYDVVESLIQAIRARYETPDQVGRAPVSDSSAQASAATPSRSGPDRTPSESRDW